jgi:exodeoxyribonuclease-3
MITFAAMRIATWNINGLRARLSFVLLWLRERQPDIVGLQELKLSDEQFPHAEIEAAGYRADGLSFTSVYCPNGKNLEHPDYPRKLAWFDALNAHLDARPDPEAPCVLCGDFNVCPEPIDSWDETRLAGDLFHTDAERARFQALLTRGFVDVFRAQHPDLQAFSWWDYRGGAFHRKQGLRIDFLLASPSVADRVTQVEIDREYRKKQEGLTASDHAPVIADLGDA